MTPIESSISTHPVGCESTRDRPQRALPDPIVFVVDDDAAVREALEDLLTARHMHSVTFGSAADYLAYTKSDAPACLILDIGLPDMDGLALQRRIVGGDHPPIIFITGCGDIASCARAFKAGAVDYLAKPFSKHELMAAVDSAIERDRVRRHDMAEIGRLRERFSSLTPREREVLPLVVGGLLNKQSAARLGIGEVTMQVHRGQVMRKMKASSLADLVRMASKLLVPLPSREDH